MKHEHSHSYGGVIFRKTMRGTRIALIARKGKTIWALPKGHADPGETPEQAALREVLEETGLTGDILKKIGDISYIFTVPEEKLKVHKKVTFYLMKHTGGSTKDHDFEVDEAACPTDARLTDRLFL